MTQQADLPEVPVDPHPRPQWLPDALVAVVLVVAAFLPAPLPEFSPRDGLATVLVLMPIVVVPWRRRWPRTVLWVLVGMFGVAALLGTLSPGVAVSIGLVMFHVAARSTRRQGFITGICAALAMMVITVLASQGSVFDPRVLQFGLAVAFAAAAGDGARSRRAYIAALNERAERAVQTREAEARRRVGDERLRIAQDLHDTVAHQIAVISLNAGVASSTIDVRPEKAKESLVTIRTAARTVLGEIGDLMTMLRADDDGDRAPRPQAGLGRLKDLIEQFAVAGLDVHSRLEGDRERVTGAVDLVAYRVVQEALTNAHKHGVEHRAHVLIRTDATQVTLTITNPMNGTIAPETVYSGVGLGLVGLRERVASVRGAVTAGPVPAGWKVEAVLPLTREGCS